MSYVTLGQIINVRGLKGELKVFNTSHFAKLRYKKGNKVYFYNERMDVRKEFTVKKYSEVGNICYLFVDEILDVDEANKYREYYIQVPTVELPSLKEDSYYYHDLIGCKLYNEEKKLLGVVESVEQFGAQDNLRVKTDKKSVLVPFIKQILVSVDVENKEIIIKEMVGLF